MRSVPQDAEDLLNQLDAIEHDAEGLSAGLRETAGTWHPAPGSWSVAECLEHLAITNGVYLAAMSGPAVHARKEGRLRDRKSTRLNSSHSQISYAVFCLKKKKKKKKTQRQR